MSITGFRLPRVKWVGTGVSLVVLIGVCACSVTPVGSWLAVAAAGQSSLNLSQAETSDAPSGPGVAVSPDRTFIAFTDKSFELAIRDLSTGLTRVLTKRPDDDVNFDYLALDVMPSPDSRRVAYVWGQEFRVIEARGGAPTVVFADTQNRGLHLFGWFPDGKSLLAGIIAGTFRGHPSQLVRVSLADGALEVLRNNWSGTRCQVSPDGRYILFDRVRPASKNRTLFLMSADGTGEVTVADDPADDNVVLGWFPDGKRLLYARNRGSAHDAMALSIENGRPSGRPAMIRPNVGRVSTNGVTRDGTWYISRALSWPSVFVADLDPRTGRAIGNLTPVPDHPWVIHSRAVSWSPTGDRLAYTDSFGWDDADGEVVVEQLPSGRTTRYPAPLGGVDRVTWSPDGRAVVFEGRASSTQAGLFKLDLTTKNASPQLLVAGENPTYPILAPDGRVFYYRQVGTQGVLMKDLQSGSEQIIPAQGGKAGTWLSPDGQTFLLLQTPQGTKSSSIDTMPVHGGPQRTVITGVEDSGNVAGWSHDSKYVLFRSGDSILRVSSAGGVAEPIGLSLPRIRSLSVHPNGRKIAVTGGEATFAVEVWQFARTGAR
jgi:Tol biopolymer transport system component